MTNHLRALTLLALATLPSASWAQSGTPDSFFDIFYDATLESIDLSGTAVLPLGEGGADVPANVTLGASQRGKILARLRKVRTSSLAFAPDELDGQEFPLESTLGLDFELTITPQGVPFASDLGDRVVVSPASGDNPLFEGSVGASTNVLFDASAPDFGITAGAQDRVYTTGRLRKMIINQRVSLGDGLDNDCDGLDDDCDGVAADGVIDIQPGSFTFTEDISGDGELEVDANSEIRRSYNASLSLIGDLGGRAFVINDLSGSVVETGTLRVVAVPEPGALGLAVMAVIGLSARRRR